MRNIAALVLLFLALTPVEADARCKFKTDESGLERGKRHTVSATMRSYVRFEFWRKSDEFFVNAIVGTVLMGIDANVDAGSPLMLTLDSGEVLELSPIEDSESRRAFLGFGINRKISGGVYELSREDAERLTSASVTDIDFSYRQDGELTSRNWKPRKGDQKRIRKGSACLFD